MKKIKVLAIAFLFSSIMYGQPITDNKKEINNIINIFMKCLVVKDSVIFYSLFHNDPIVWTGIYKERTQQMLIKKDSSAKDFFSDTYKEFYRFISDQRLNEEKFDNIKIIEDGSVASATFDYSFWYKNKMQNWGSEHWGLIKTNGKWKITSVIFSMELSLYFEQPSLLKRKNK